MPRERRCSARRACPPCRRCSPRRSRLCPSDSSCARGRPVQDPDQADLVMHAQLTTDDGLVLMAADTPNGMTYEAPAGISVSLSGNTQARTQEVWDALAAGATVTMPLDIPPWGGTFGMLVDRFGIAWMLHGAPE
ncbi:VOC family protein [Microbacterium sp. LS_15]|uniref:VOC family protein n=1 Tax=Microbacterium sp. LS_15 TaxID=3055790 RepID=UPI0035BF944E